MLNKSRITIIVATLGCVILNSIFSKYNLAGIRPDMIMVLAVCLGILVGNLRSQLICGGIGLLYDIFVCKQIGINCAIYVVAGLVSGLFFRKYYTDNVVFPAIITAILAFFAQNLQAIFVALNGASYNYGLMLAIYILPCCLLTAGVLIPVYAVLKPLLFEYGRFISDRR